MEAVDELMTPGCPNCAAKHLSAALFCLIDMPGQRDTDETDVLLARAYVNLVESYEGYASHRHYAIGLLVAAEDCAIRRAGDVRRAEAIRRIRVELMTNDFSNDPLGRLCGQSYGALAAGHVREAFREFPVLFDRFQQKLPPASQEGVDSIVGMIRWIEEEYLTAPDVPEGKGGESTMACGKKAVPAKGGKTVKAACKGGKCGGGKKAK